jgi:hypothetical protein
VSKTARTFVMLFLLAFAVRLGVGLWTGMSREPVEDEQGYVITSNSVAGLSSIPEVTPQPVFAIYRVFSDPTWRVECRTSFRAPVVPIFFATVAAAGGGVAWMRMISILLGALGPPLLFLALRNSSLGDRAWWPAAAYALWPPAIYESVRALSEAPSQALLLGGLAALCMPRTRGGVLGGALAALAVLARPAALFPAGMLVLATASRRRALGFLVAFMAVLAPWEIRNWNLHGRILMTTNSGVTLVGGNNDVVAQAEHPGKWAPPERVYAGSADPPDLGMWGWSKLSEEASDRRFAADAMKWIGDHPGAWARLEFWKIVRLFDPDPHSEKDDAAGKALVGWLTFAPVLLLAMIGAVSAWRSEWPWTILVVGTVATALLFYGDTRMRTCADPALLVLAAHGVTSVARRLRGRTVD